MAQFIVPSSLSRFSCVAGKVTVYSEKGFPSYTTHVNAHASSDTLAVASSRITIIMNEQDIQLQSDRYRQGGSQIDKYITDLLPHEINFIEQNQLALDAPAPSGKRLTLVILVGLTFEPLLQSIEVHRPQRVIPILNTVYGDSRAAAPNAPKRDACSGQDHWDDLSYYIQLLPCYNESPFELPTTLETVTDSPESVYRFLRDNQTLQADLKDADCNVVIDITGAKKTIVVGAFLFAAYSNAKIRYLDATVFKNLTQPYGYSCHYLTVNNPIRSLAIGHWEQFELRYAQYDFEGAQQSLLLIMQLEQAPEAIYEVLNLFLTICDLWEQGQLGRANVYRKKLQGLSAHVGGLVPNTVAKLGPFWQDANTTTTLKPRTNVDRFLASPTHVHLYAQDELLRSRRLAGIENAKGLEKKAPTHNMRVNYRAAFTRAYAVHETLINSRFMVSPRTGNRLINHAGKTLDELKNRDALPEVDRATLQLNPELAKIRNQVTHSYFPISRENASASIEQAQNNLDGYERDWLTTEPIRPTSRPPLDVLLEACALTPWRIHNVQGEETE